MTWSSEESLSYCVLEKKNILAVFGWGFESGLGKGRDKDVMSAVKRYNNVLLDGKPVEIEIVGTNIATPAMPPAANGSSGNLHGVPRRVRQILMDS
ncbi:THO complex subunit 4A-like isoform X1 [Camellia sinensis]|uniref:THO complex subunit 4A-like isoform X1 n=1 Tax=Camellia sinensis TaxID=4442 RepID=UPI0010360B3D|nr:THO complex subunit 4A-like isoform X1 [Camellia sinensis]